MCVAAVAGCGGGGGGALDGGRSGDGGSDGDGGIVGPGCGNGAIDDGEVCDDGNAASGDGCSADCLTVETGWYCTVQGIRCMRAQVCGNGFLETGETCDDRNTTPGDGCDANCAIEPGWACAVPGIRCTAAACGDGIVAGFEECDDGNSAAGDGCSARCTLEVGHKCEAAGQPCTTTTCGDGIAEGAEQCDDGNHDLGDGCDTQCRREPHCTNGVCDKVCGDGVLQIGEACDDGNLRDFDGCSSTCEIESGFSCTLVTPAAPTTLPVSIVYRDFRGFDLTNGHPDFEHANGDDPGIVTDTLGSDHKPVYASSTTTATTHGAVAFQSWYRDTIDVNMTYAEQLVLSRTPAGTYVYANTAFFPLDGRGFVGAGTEPSRKDDKGVLHNFSFTSELRYWFDFKGGEALTFLGDDDVWVFINNKRAVDIGGVHNAESKTVTLDDITAATLGLSKPANPDDPNAQLSTYEVALFQAERHTQRSQYTLTLKGFNAKHSQCSSVCGDGITASDEVCDDGKNDGTYGSCVPGCKGFGPRCGDGIVQAGYETCDDGINKGGYDSCTPTCTVGPHCGDGHIDPGHETCDDGNTDPTDGCDKCQQIVQ